MAEDQAPARALPTGKPTLPTQPATGTDTVTVVCKIPNGLILPLGRMVDGHENVQGGGTRPVRYFEPSQRGERVVLRGPALDMQAMRAGKFTENPLAGGFALTSGVRKDWWEQIEILYANYGPFLDGSVKAFPNADAAISYARNLHSLETGFEGIDPDNPAKRTGIRGVTRAERPAAA